MTGFFWLMSEINDSGVGIHLSATKSGRPQFS